jgi:hypothetical protein
LEGKKGRRKQIRKGRRKKGGRKRLDKTGNNKNRQKIYETEEGRKKQRKGKNK